ncbi:MAG: hypothetical protein M1837_004425 [Sclerophora amabilis]|nr:MAG: hypothetical protein M1837_004425 [Sclerophora amabilis]
MIEKHKSRLKAEFTKIRVRRKFATDKAFKEFVDSNNGKGLSGGVGMPSSVLSDGKHMSFRPPRWVRINTLKTTLEQQILTTFAKYLTVDHLADLATGDMSASESRIFVDHHIPDLIALSPGTNVTETQAYRDGKLILQNKASCFPAHLLAQDLGSGGVIDACAAPGNKTTHLAALIVKGKDTKHHNGKKVWAIERDKARSKTLQDMVTTAGAQSMVTVMPGTDFLRLDPENESWLRISALLLDPSCSGSGMVGREEPQQVIFPSASGTPRRGKKRPYSVESHSIPMTNDDSEDNLVVERDLPQRLSMLAAFQQKMLIHAFRFSSARRVVYSTCSIYAEENENVIVGALRSAVAREKGWRILSREEQISGLCEWNTRGDLTACSTLISDQQDASNMAEACIRCYRNDEEGMMGFFVAGFTRDTATSLADSEPLSLDETGPVGLEESETDWEGISD